MASADKPLAVFLAGPTASGKTKLAVELVQTGKFEIISVDSALVYRGMDIGTAKPDQQTLAIAPHRLIDICDPVESYSASRFRDDALAAMQQITAAGKIPLLVGGTMLYFKALQFGLSELPESSPEIREKLEDELARLGSSAMHQRLAGVDPVISQRIHQNDPQRIMRALEVYEITGRPLSELQSSTGKQVLDYKLKKFAIAPDNRQILHQNIEKRFNLMMQQGFEQEVRQLINRRGLHADLPSMRSVGYRQMLQYLNGEMDRETMIEKAIIATRQLAKRQFTWLRADPDYVWLDSLEDNLVDKVLAQLPEPK